MEPKEKTDLIQNSVDLERFRNFTYHYEILRDPEARFVELKFTEPEAHALSCVNTLAEQTVYGSCETPWVLKPLPELTDMAERCLMCVGRMEIVIDQGMVWLPNWGRWTPSCVIPISVLRSILKEYRESWETCLEISNTPGHRRSYRYSFWTEDGLTQMGWDRPDPVLSMLEHFLYDFVYDEDGKLDIRNRSWSDSYSGGTKFIQNMDHEWIRIGYRDCSLAGAVCIPKKIIPEMHRDMIDSYDKDVAVWPSPAELKEWERFPVPKRLPPPKRIGTLKYPHPKDIGKVMKHWRDLQLSGKMWPMP